MTYELVKIASRPERDSDQSMGARIRVKLDKAPGEEWIKAFYAAEPSRPSDSIFIVEGRAITFTYRSSYEIDPFLEELKERMAAANEAIREPAEAEKAVSDEIDAKLARFRP